MKPKNVNELLEYISSAVAAYVVDNKDFDFEIDVRCTAKDGFAMSQELIVVHHPCILRERSDVKDVLKYKI